MKRDFDLIRHILFKIESHPSLEGLSSDGFKVGGYTDEMIRYNLKLMQQAGLVDGTDLSDFETFKLDNINLTWEGHELLDNIRNAAIWRQATSRVEETADGVSFEIMKFALTEIIKKAIII